MGPARGDVQAALIASVLGNIHRDPDKKREPYTIADFLPNWSGEVKRMDDDELERIAKAAAMTIGEGDIA